jgi:hypothetical protein
VTTTTAPPALCPLTGAPVPGGRAVPARPALGVKIDNYPSARPQSGLDLTDDVFEEPVEGGITRYVAVFQCQDGGLVGPVRSARNIDIGILGQLGAPLIAHVGGIAPVIGNIDASPIKNIDLGAYAQVDQHPSGRYAPYDTYATTSSLWGLVSRDNTVPAALFSYSATVPQGSPVTAVLIPFSGTSNVVWHYNSGAQAFERFYGYSADMLADGHQVSAANVIVQQVQVFYGPWLENDQGGLEVQANLYNGASGPAEIFRNGTEVTGSWHRSSLAQPTQYEDAQGQPISLAPGNTWIELVPSGISVSTLNQPG